MWLSSKIELDNSGKLVEEKNAPSAYMPTDEEKEMLVTIRTDFVLGDLTMQKPRREFNDLSVIQRNSVDTLTWNTYQPNDGDSLEGDVNAWRSNAVRAVTRNKVMGIAAHVTARLVYPHMFAYSNDSREEVDAAQVMNDLFEFSTTNETSTYMETSMFSVFSALVAPASIVYTEYSKVYRTVRLPQTDGNIKVEKILDEDMSGFKDEIVPVDQFYIADFYEPNIQRQRFVLWRRVRDYTTSKERWGDYSNYQYVKPGMMILYNDANQAFYETYDADMRPYEVEEILYWNKHLDLFEVIVNGILITSFNNPNPREDKLYPFAKYFFEAISPQNRCFYGKSLVFKNMPDDKVINTLYPMVMDGTYLALMPPQIITGGEIISSDVMIPGAVTTLSSPDAGVKPLLTASQNLKAAYDAMLEVEKSMDESTISSQQMGQQVSGDSTAYELSKMESNAQQMLGLFVKMETQYVKQFSRLRIGDIKQHMTLPELEQIEGSGNTKLIYRTFMVSNKHTIGTDGNRKVRFSLDHPTKPISENEKVSFSYKLLDEVGQDSKDTLLSVHPTLFRSLNYMAIVSPDVMTPMSQEIKRAFDLEQYDRMVQNPHFAPDAVARLLLQAYDQTRKDPDKYIAKQAAPSQISAPAAPPGQGISKQTPEGTKPLMRA